MTDVSNTNINSEYLDFPLSYAVRRYLARLTDGLILVSPLYYIGFLFGFIKASVFKLSVEQINRA